MTKNIKNADASFTEKLYELTGNKRKESLDLRPSKEFLRLIHLIREIAAAVAFRPISFENKGYLVERARELNNLGKKLDNIAGKATPGWKHIAEKLLGILSYISEESNKQDFINIVVLCDRSGYKEFWKRSILYMPVYHTPLLTKKYTKVMIFTGPAIGLGDEITCKEFLDSLHDFLSSAEFNLYGFYPKFWKMVAPSFNVFSLVGNPLEFFEILNKDFTPDQLKETLVLFINFSGLDLHLTFCQDKNRPDIAEISVGKGMMWFMNSNGGPIQVIEAMDTLNPSNYSAMRVLSQQLIGKTSLNKKACTKPVIHTNRNKFKIVVNPFTSKDIFLTPIDWFVLIKTMLDFSPGRKDVSCMLLPGLSEESMKYAYQIVHENNKSPFEGLEIHVLGNGKYRNPEIALEKVCKCISSADLLIGMDTFTAHLASVLSTPSVAICYHRNTAFWQDSPLSFWVEVQHGADFISHFFALILKLLGGIKNESSAIMEKILGSKEFTRFELTIQEFQNGSNKTTLTDVINFGKAAWDCFPKKYQDLLSGLDANYSWPVIESLSGFVEKDKKASQWLFGVIKTIHFTKISCLIASHNKN